MIPWIGSSISNVAVICREDTWKHGGVYFKGQTHCSHLILQHCCGYNLLEGSTKTIETQHRYASRDSKSGRDRFIRILHGRISASYYKRVNNAWHVLLRFTSGNSARQRGEHDSRTHTCTLSSPVLLNVQSYFLEGGGKESTLLWHS